MRKGERGFSRRTRETKKRQEKLGLRIQPLLRARGKKKNRRPDMGGSLESMALAKTLSLGVNTREKLKNMKKWIQCY